MENFRIELLALFSGEMQIALHDTLQRCTLSYSDAQEFVTIYGPDGRLMYDGDTYEMQNMVSSFFTCEELPLTEDGEPYLTLTEARAAKSKEAPLSIQILELQASAEKLLRQANELKAQIRDATH